jgi:hypothetical protein
MPCYENVRQLPQLSSRSSTGLPVLDSAFNGCMYLHLSCTFMHRTDKSPTWTEVQVSRMVRLATERSLLVIDEFGKVKLSSRLVETSSMHGTV